MNKTGSVDYWCNMFTPEGLKRQYVDPPEFAWPAQKWGISKRGKGVGMGNGKRMWEWAKGKMENEQKGKEEYEK